MILVGKTYEERLRCCKVSLSTGCAQYGVDMSMFQNELLVDRLMAIAENKLLNIPDQEKEAQRQVSLHAIRGLNGTVNMSTSPQISQAELLVDLAKDTLLSFPDLEKDALRQGSLAATAGFNATTDMSALPQISQTAVPMVGGPGLFGGALMALLIVTALLALGCSICFLKGLDRKPASSPQQAKENKKLGRSRHALGSASSLGVSEGMMRPPPCSAASLASARSYASRATRDSCAGRLLSARVRGRDVGGSPNGAGALGLGTTPGGAPATKMFSFEGQRASINSAQRLNKAWYTPSPQAGDSRFTVPVDTLVNVAAQGGFDIKDRRRQRPGPASEPAPQRRWSQSVADVPGSSTCSSTPLYDRGPSQATLVERPGQPGHLRAERADIREYHLAVHWVFPRERTRPAISADRRERSRPGPPHLYYT
ncbi:unnamed protein product [Prorocentrum cordatum]|uniref:Uncharacterized protein n=1 Tax=Prorocentrum cordatum TaxID=2364126 RepID=A0ABN9UCC5_9DINO|nr:unnamed protein product [Polarella glacialis]